MRIGRQLDERPIFVTGANGFIGSHLTEKLVEYGGDVIVEANASLILDVGQAAGYRGDVDVVQRRERDRPGDSDVDALLADYSKLHEETGWEPEVSPRDGVRDTIEWFETNRERWWGRVDWT